ncbi:type II toxin-antitoxin system antitoxin SocA domain-containing protein [Burkholderia vietnamiensis]|uniref:type II toxin-antitoxin system antitoxin SocA domain-containing protein n=1 Tax=Burkholderia vietnamiensis TaxID=60552 RepID=UPI001B960B99|nr:type II toxin-antitoxin system antitoxin SocA domain-containing protein [Burkholderia vietnamiensis]MBR8000356.1 DUF4065 domain-containing protein [Burkholderia vietnamiensis]
MLISRDHERLINAMIFFAGETRLDTRAKLYHLLYMLDFEHFRSTGQSVTGCEYEAERRGPVPVQVAQAWDDPTNAFHAAANTALAIGRRHRIPDTEARTRFDDSHFTRRQLDMLRALVQRFRDAHHPDLEEIGQVDNGAFARVWHDGIGARAPIPYELAISGEDPHADKVRMSARRAHALGEISHRPRRERA